jgi:carboxypeptidase family protein
MERLRLSLNQPMPILRRDLKNEMAASCRSLPVHLVTVLLLTSFSWAQAAAGTLRGQVTDPSGAVIGNAKVMANAAGTGRRVANTDAAGNFEIADLPAGRYSVTVAARGFTTLVRDVQVTAGQTEQFNVSLEIEVEKEKIEVQGEEGSQVQVNPANNASAIVISGKDLEALPDDPDELEQDLQALAGPSAGPNGGQIYIDGFTGGQLPPKSSIREIRINQNPFSAEYDKLGYGRIEIFTKPGSDKYHGQLSLVGNSAALNSRNPFLTQEPPYYSTIYMGNIGGPLSKKASFFFDVQRRNIDEFAVVNAVVLDSNLNPIQFSESVSNPRKRTNLSPRLDYQITPNNTLTARYQYFHDTQDNAGVGQFALASTGYDTASWEHTVQISDTQVFGTKVVNETRFQYMRNNNRQTPLTTGPTLNVIGAFTGGGSSAGTLADHTDHYELQNYVSLAQGSHLVKFGGRLRAVHEIETSGSGFNGTFTFSSLAAYQSAEQILASGATTAPGASQFSISASPSGGIPTVSATVADAGLYAQDDWRVRPNVTLSYGLRFETQNAIHDHADWAPRLAVAWGIGGGSKNVAKTVLRAGYGIFYDRFAENLVLNSERLNGQTQQQYIVAATASTPIDFFPLVPPVNTLPASQTTPAIYQIDSALHAAYVMQSAVSLERQVTKNATVTLSYLNSRGVHQFLSRNVNAPLPGTPYSIGPRPDPAAGNVDQYTSEGTFRQNQLITNFNIRLGQRLGLFGYYSLNYAHSDTSGASSFPSNQYDLALDYGRASFDVRHRLFLGGTIGLPYAFRLSPFMVANSGSPYNVTVGQDLSGDSLFNDRPAFATNVSGACLSPTSACHYMVPTQTYTPIPVNYLSGPPHFTLNLRLSKTFGFGPETRGGGPPQGDRRHGGGPREGGGFGRPMGGPFMLGAATSRRYNLTFSVNARNVLNRVNLATPIGNLNSPLFGESNALAGGPFSSAAANRKLELQAAFSF